MIVALYLLAIVTANWSVATFGAPAAVFNTLVLIAFDLTARDALHNKWQHRHLWRNMTLLIASGSILSAALSWSFAPIALASFLAFAAAGIADALVYQQLLGAPRMLRSNGSNVVSAAIDSFVFVALAFGTPVLWPVIFQSYMAKVIGGAIWAWLFFGKRPQLSFKQGL